MHKTVFIAGPSASGKSTLSRRLAQEIGFNWLDTGSVIRMTALVMEQKGVRLPDSDETALDTPCPPWAIGHMDQPGEVPIYVDGMQLNYDDPRLRNPTFDTSTLQLARALRPRTWNLLRAVSMLGQSVISCRQVPESLLRNDAVLPLYLDLSPQDRVARRARYEHKVVDPEITRRVIEKEEQNIALGNLVSPEEALNKNYVLVRNDGTLDRSASQMLLEVLRKYKYFSPEDYESVLKGLQTVDPALKHFTRWDDLVNTLCVNSHPEGYIRGKEIY